MTAQKSLLFYTKILIHEIDDFCFKSEIKAEDNPQFSTMIWYKYDKCCYNKMSTTVQGFGLDEHNDLNTSTYWMNVIDLHAIYSDLHVCFVVTCLVHVVICENSFQGFH